MWDRPYNGRSTGRTRGPFLAFARGMSSSYNFFGVRPEVGWLAGSGVLLENGVAVDEGLRASVPGIFAAGDCAAFLSRRFGRRLRVEHWDVAFNHGKTAALNMLGHDQPHDVVPYFFSDLSNWASLEYVGPASEWDQEVVRGSIDDGEFSIFYLSDGRVVRRGLHRWWGIVLI